MERVDLKTGYYLENFERLLDHVHGIYSDILPTKHKGFLKTFTGLSVNGRRLFVRLSMRSKAFYRTERLNYPEIDLTSAISELEKHELLEVNPLIEFPDIWEAFTVSDLKNLYPILKETKAPKGKRNEIIEGLIPAGKKETALFYKSIFDQHQILWPLFQEEWEHFKLFFFGSRFQDMEQFILEDLGIMKFEPIAIDKKNRLFQSWKELEASYLWSEYHAELWEWCEEKNIDEAKKSFNKIKKLPLHSPPMKRKYSRSTNLYGKLLESSGDHKQALRLFSTSTMEPARERVARLYDKMGYSKRALKHCEEIISMPLSEGERYFAEFFKEKMKRSLGLEYQKVKRLKVPDETPLPLTWDREVGVETQVLNYYLDQGYRGFYCENNYFPTIAALLFWQEYWSPGVGVFYHPFEQAPRDFRSGEFYRRALAIIEKKKKYWLSLKKGERNNEILRLFTEKKGTACSLTSWKRVEKKNLKLILQTVPIETLLSISLQVLQDPRQYCSGFPDLFLVNPEKDYILGEVKSPNDTIQTSQKRWIEKFISWDIPFLILRTK